MQEKNRVDVKKILLTIALHVNAKGIRGLATKLEENENKLYAWIKQGNIADTGSILGKYPYFRKEWLETGTGPMLSEKKEPQAELPVVSEPPNTPYAPTELTITLINHHLKQCTEDQCSEVLQAVLEIRKGGKVVIAPATEPITAIATREVIAREAGFRGKKKHPDKPGESYPSRVVANGEGL